MLSKQFNDESSSPFILIDIRVWDALDIYETRVYGHIKRRAGENSHCWESLGNIAKHVGFGRTKLKEVTQSLAGKGLLKKEKGDVGGTDRYFLTSPSHWVLAIPSSQDEHPLVAGRPPTQSRGDHKVDPSKVDPSKNNSPDRTKKKKSANAESLTPSKETSKPQTTSLNPLQDSLNLENESTYQNTSEGITEGILDTNQSINDYPLVVDPNLVGGERGSEVARSIKPDKSKDLFGKTRTINQQKVRAKKGSEAGVVEAGIANKRWSDLAGYERFSDCVVEHLRQCNSGEKKDFAKIEDPETYLRGVLYKTAHCSDESSSDLTCWKMWNLEPLAPNYIETKPDEVVVVDDAAEAAWQVIYTKFQADNLARKAAAAAEKVRKDEIVRGLYES